jgi:hypothetical protein
MPTRDDDCVENGGWDPDILKAVRFRCHPNIEKNEQGNSNSSGGNEPNTRTQQQRDAPGTSARRNPAAACTDVLLRCPAGGETFGSTSGGSEASTTEFEARVPPP